MTDRSRGRSRGIALLTGLLLLSGCGRGRIKEVPPELLGVWRTDAPGYQDRFMEIRPREIIFGTGPGSADIHTINGLRRRAAPGHIDFTIFYDNVEGQEYEFSIIFEYSEGGQITLTNQRNMVWRRRPVSPRR